MRSKIAWAIVIMAIMAVTLTAGCTTTTTTKTITAPNSTTSITVQPTTTNLPATRTIVDMAGRTVVIPANFSRITCLYPGCTFLVYRLAPDKLVNIDSVSITQINNRQNPYPQSDMSRLLNLTQTGVYFKGYNVEQILATNPDIILSSTKDPNADKEQKELGIPVICISDTVLYDYPAEFQFTGSLLGDEKDAKKMAEIWNNTLNNVSAVSSEIPQDQKVKVYYASHDGPLSTVGSNTLMASIIRMAGGRSFMDEVPPAANNLSGEHQVATIEEIIKWDPDVIVTKTLAEKNQILADPQWQGIAAVKNGRVYSCLKYERMDGYQSALSVEWLANTLYPDRYHYDLTTDVKTFYSEFFNYNISDEEINLPFSS